jgi:hypothetical protein
MPDSWGRAALHAAAHHGVLSTAAACRLDISPPTLHGWVQRGRLVRPAPEAYVVAGTPPTWHQRVAVATASGEAWASHRTAAALWGLDGFAPAIVEVLTHHGRRRHRTAWVAHESRALRGVDLDERGGIPCTALPRTLLDVAAVAHPFRTGQALDDACRRWPGLLELVARRFEELARRGRPGTRLMRAMLEERLGRGRFTQSGFEALALRLVLAAGLPEPVLQHTVRDRDFVCHLDLAWPAVLLGLECDSLAYHSGKRPHEWDRQRRRRLKLLGWDVIEVTYDDVTLRAASTARELRELYERRALSFWQR